MCEYANVQIRRHVHKQTHEHAYVHVGFQYFRCDTFSPSSEDKNIGFGGLCLTNAHLAFRLKGFSRRFAPQNHNGYAFALLHMCILPHLRITTNGKLPQHHITIKI